MCDINFKRPAGPGLDTHSFTHKRAKCSEDHVSTCQNTSSSSEQCTENDRVQPVALYIYM